MNQPTEQFFSGMHKCGVKHLTSGTNQEPTYHCTKELFTLKNLMYIYLHRSQVGSLTFPFSQCCLRTAAGWVYVQDIL